MGHFGLENPHNSLSTQRIYFKILQSERGRQVHESFICCFSRKIQFKLIFLAVWPFLLFDWAWSNWARPLLIGSLNRTWHVLFKDRTCHVLFRILKQWRHDFSGKHLCVGYCMDIMWCLCVEVKIQGFVKLY